jgi:hypothetical protein
MGLGVRVIAAAVALALTIGARASTTARPPSFQIRKPTIIAFFPPVSDKDLDDDPDTGDALDDFQSSADEVRGPLKKAGVDFEETYTRSFTVHVDAKTIVFRVGKDDVGYYFIAPGKKPHIEYGVMTDEDILSEAHEYFGVAIPGSDAGHQAMLIDRAANPAVGELARFERSAAL